MSPYGGSPVVEAVWNRPRESYLDLGLINIIDPLLNEGFGSRVLSLSSTGMTTTVYEIPDLFVCTAV